MPIVAGSITVGEFVIKKVEPFVRNGAGSFQALRDQIYKQTIPQTITSLPSKKIREVDNTLIQYKKSAFLSDMLSSSKD